MIAFLLFPVLVIALSVPMVGLRLLAKQHG